MRLFMAAHQVLLNILQDCAADTGYYYIRVIQGTTTYGYYDVWVIQGTTAVEVRRADN